MSAVRKICITAAAIAFKRVTGWQGDSQTAEMAVDSCSHLVLDSPQYSYFKYFCSAAGSIVPREGTNAKEDAKMSSERLEADNDCPMFSALPLHRGSPESTERLCVMRLIHTSQLLYLNTPS